MKKPSINEDLCMYEEFSTNCKSREAGDHTKPDLRDVEIDDLRRQVQQLQEELARVKVVNEEDEVHDDDSACCSNVVATSMVEKLQLKMEDHPRPYNIHWIRKGNKVKEKDVSFISGACIEKKMFESQMGYVLVVMEESRSRIVEHNPLYNIDIDHCSRFCLYLILDAYRIESKGKEHEELQRQVDELLKKGVLQESKSPCAVPAFWYKKKMALGV
ncbi:hypothetical protein Tco_1225637, partial [Tanacetum coccineum]